MVSFIWIFFFGVAIVYTTQVKQRVDELEKRITTLESKSQ